MGSVVPKGSVSRVWARGLGFWAQVRGFLEILGVRSSGARLGDLGWAQGAFFERRAILLLSEICGVRDTVTTA